MVEQIDISGLDKAEVLAALHNGTQPLGMGFLHNIGHCTVDQASEDVSSMGGALRFDYYHGRPLKVNITGDSFYPGSYDRDAGEGTAQRVISELRASKV